MSKALIQTLAVAGSAITFAALVINLSRRNLLSFRYTVGWLVLLAIAALSSLVTPLVRPIADVLGTTEGVVVSAIAVVVLLTICIQLSISVSGLQAQIRKIAEDVALSRPADPES